MKKFALTIISLALATTFANAAAIVLGNSPTGTYAVDATAGARLPAGDAVLVGTFSSPANIDLSLTNAQTILSNAGFSQFGGTGVTGTYIGSTGHLLSNNAFLDNTETSFDNKPVYVIVFNSSSISSATQIAIIRATNAAVPWTFAPQAGGLGDSVTISLQDASLVSVGTQNSDRPTAGVLTPISPGNLGAGQVIKLTSIGPVPEPSSALLVALGSTGLLSLRRRK